MVRRRLTKAQVEALFAAIDEPFDVLVAALGDAVAALHGSADLDAALRADGRAETADRIAAGDRVAAWDLVAELNERRHL